MKILDEIDSTWEPLMEIAKESPAAVLEFRKANSGRIPKDAAVIISRNC